MGKAEYFSEEQGAINSADFRRIKSVNCCFFFKEWCNILSPWEGRREILFNFWQAEKLQKHWNWFFSPEKERKKRKLKSDKSLAKTISWRGSEVTERSAQWKPPAWEKDQTLRNGKFLSNFEGV